MLKEADFINFLLKYKFSYILFNDPVYTRFSNRKTHSYSSYSIPLYLKLKKYILNLPHRPSPRNSSQIPSPATRNQYK
jgi:hypothetical protein